MEKEIIKLEHTMWEAALHQDTKAFQKLVLPDAVMVCGGYRCLGSEYAGYIADFSISGYHIGNMEVIHCGEQEITLHYTIHTETTDPCAQDLAGHFHIVSMWKKTGDTWNLFFNMDSRMTEA